DRGTPRPHERVRIQLRQPPFPAVQRIVPQAHPRPLLLRASAEHPQLGDDPGREHDGGLRVRARGFARAPRREVHVRAVNPLPHEGRGVRALQPNPALLPRTQRRDKQRLVRRVHGHEISAPVPAPPSLIFPGSSRALKHEHGQMRLLPCLPTHGEYVRLSTSSRRRPPPPLRRHHRGPIRRRLPPVPREEVNIRIVRPLIVAGGVRAVEPDEAGVPRARVRHLLRL
ncbi:hypothetical protein T484DRAFT_3648621, partial [Baffinella frigidus]